MSCNVKKRKVEFLRRLFISILILSTLTSEGTVNLYESIYELLYPYMESGLSVYLDDNSSEQLREAGTESYYCSPDLSSIAVAIFKVRNDETKRTGFKDKDCSVPRIGFRHQSQSMLNISYALSFVLPNEDIILEESDLSPPALIYA